MNRIVHPWLFAAAIGLVGLLIGIALAPNIHPGDITQEYIVHHNLVMGGDAEIVHATSTPPGWKKITDKRLGVSFSVPPSWSEGDLGDMVSGLEWHDTAFPNAHFISIEYRGPDTEVFIPGTFLSESRENLFNTHQVRIGGISGIYGAFYNPLIWLTQIQIYVVYGNHGLVISIPGNWPDDDVQRVLSTLTFI